MSLGQGLEQAIAELAAAQATLEDAARATAIARSTECTCLNRVNDAQKEVDEMVAAIKAKAHIDSDWGHARYGGRASAAAPS